MKILIISSIIIVMMSNHLHAYELDNIAYKHILPTYNHLIDETSNLNKIAKQYCENNSKEALLELRKAASKAFISWQSAQHLRFGPVQVLSREYRYEFWPDKRGIVGKQLRKLLNDPTLQPDKPFDISRKSVAVQGFSALEQLLQKEQHENNDCIVITAITRNLQTMSERILEGWTDDTNAFLISFLNPGVSNLFFSNETEVASRLLNSLYTQLELIITQKIALPLGNSIEKSRKKSAQAWRSQLALPAIEANLNACYQLYQFSFAPELKDTKLSQQISASFENTLSIVQSIDTPLSEAVSQSEQREKIKSLKAELSRLKQLLVRDMAKALNLSIGFNSLDGD
jgi:predicted lipoprotein